MCTTTYEENQVKKGIINITCTTYESLLIATQHLLNDLQMPQNHSYRRLQSRTGSRADEGGQQCVPGVCSLSGSDTGRGNRAQMTQVAGDTRNAHQPALFARVVHFLAVCYVAAGEQRARVIPVRHLRQPAGF